jgi:hypothetical protein
MVKMKIKAFFTTKDLCNRYLISQQPQTRKWMEWNAEVITADGKTIIQETGRIYKCLPVKIANQIGWQIECPIDFECLWEGGVDIESLKIRFKDEDSSIFRREIKSHFGNGILTFSIPYIFSTPRNYSLYVRGPTNYYKEYCQYLDAVIESDWLMYSFTYNIKIHKPNTIISFKKGEPLFCFIPINLSKINNSNIEILNINTNPKLAECFGMYSWARHASAQYFYKTKDKFISEDSKSEEQIKNGFWMKDYFLGRSPNGGQSIIGCPYMHFIKLHFNINKKENIFSYIFNASKSINTFVKYYLYKFYIYKTKFFIEAARKKFVEIMIFGQDKKKG